MAYRLRVALCGLAAAFLTACGGGTTPGLAALGAAATPAAAPPVASTVMFDVQAAISNIIADARTLQFRVDGQAGGVAYEGTGSLEQAQMQPVDDFAGNGPALAKQSTVRMSLNVNGQQVSSSTTSQEYYGSAGLRPLGQAGSGAEFVQVTNFSPAPSAAAVGTGGVLYTASRYKDPTKLATTGTTTVLYELQADSGSTALLLLRTVERDNGGTIRSAATNTYRIGPSGSFAPVAQSVVDAAGGAHFRATFL